jgi:glycosyltransferase involved in cell wall biosynthesis
VVQQATRVSVLMPTYMQAALIRRAIESVCAQTMTSWQLVIVDDGSPDGTREVVKRYLDDDRIIYVRLERNIGLGAALNRALALASAPLIAYLPSDDLYYADHVESLAAELERNPEAVLAFSGVKHEIRVPGAGVVSRGSSMGQIEGYLLQRVQVMHRRTNDRWTERDELVTDDLERMYWSRLRGRGAFVGTGAMSCEWVDHPRQRHKVIREPFGGINPYRSRFGVREPLRFHSSVGGRIDEVEHYRRFRERPDTPPAPDGLKILLVGELAFNPERVLALEERGHRLYGLWTPDGHWYNAVGPLPFGHVEDLPRHDWRDAVRRVRPDVIYALLNWQAVPFAHHVLTENPGIPFVWHLKEGPFDCIANGTWPRLLDLVTRSDGQIYSSPELLDWFETVVPEISRHGRSLVLDGDLPKRDWFTSDRSARLSESDGQIHTVIVGNPVGLHGELVARLAERGVHLHFYGDVHRGFNRSWTEETRSVAPDHLHLHPTVTQDRWVSELSKYDAGWLHLLRSGNEGDVRRADWGDLNYPARMPTLVSAGLPLVQLDNDGAVVATQSLARRLGIGLFLGEPDQLIDELSDAETMARVQANVWEQRETFTFDAHADRLIKFFRRVISART